MNAKTVVVLMLMVFVTGIAFAGQSVNIRVSCTIPAIPGVNVPSIIEEKQVSQNDRATLIQMEEQLYKAENETALAQQEEPKKETQLACVDTKDKPMTLQTVYSR